MCLVCFRTTRTVASSGTCESPKPSSQLEFRENRTTDRSYGLRFFFRKPNHHANFFNIPHATIYPPQTAPWAPVCLFYPRPNVCEKFAWGFCIWEKNAARRSTKSRCPRPDSRGWRGATGSPNCNPIYVRRACRGANRAGKFFYLLRKNCTMCLPRECREDRSCVRDVFPTCVRHVVVPRKPLPKKLYDLLCVFRESGVEGLSPPTPPRPAHPPSSARPAPHDDTTCHMSLLINGSQLCTDRNFGTLV